MKYILHEHLLDEYKGNRLEAFDNVSEYVYKSDYKGMFKYMQKVGLNPKSPIEDKDGNNVSLISALKEYMSTLEVSEWKTLLKVMEKFFPDEAIEFKSGKIKDIY